MKSNTDDLREEYAKAVRTARLGSPMILHGGIERVRVDEAALEFMELIAREREAIAKERAELAAERDRLTKNFEESLTMLAAKIACVADRSHPFTAWLRRHLGI